jgi:anhydro-N-acetylmuramic acid kinase
MSRLGALLDQYASKRVRTLVALHSGTSADAIMAALLQVEGSQETARATLVRCQAFPYPAAFREKLVELFARETATVPKFGQAHFYLGELFAQAANKIASAAGDGIAAVDGIICSGQITFHVRRGQDARDRWLGAEEIPAALDTGEGTVIAERTGRLVVTNMRSRDVAAGGQGNPLVVYGDWVLFRHPTLARTVLNIGGIANPTILPPGADLDQVRAFDTGPGNMLIDALIRRLTDGREAYDAGGARAAQGQVDHALLDWLMTHEYVRRPPPKTTGREVFGRPMMEALLQRIADQTIAPDDLLATVTAFTAESIGYNYRAFVLPEQRVDEVLVCGGGAHNLTLMRMLRERLAPIRVSTVADAGVPVEAREVTCVGIIGNETLLGEPGNVPSATGAARRVVMGQITPP